MSNNFLNTTNTRSKGDKKDKIEVLKKELSCNNDKVLYIMLSTMNQMVNYIPLKFFAFGNVLNITTNHEDNKKWDENLGENTMGKKYNSFEVLHSELLNINQIKTKLAEKLRKEYKNTFFWNITGGQRPFVMAIYDLISNTHSQEFAFLNNKTHYLCYLEGNSGEMKIMKFENGKIINKDSDSYPYSIEGLNIEVALKLMGFKIKQDEKRKKSFEDLKKEPLTNLYQKLWDAICEHEDLRLKFVETNKIKDKNTGKTLDLIERNKIKNDLLALLLAYSFSHDEINEVSNKIDFKLEKYPFGYILEYITGYVLLNCCKDYIADMSMSESLYFDDEDLQKKTSKYGKASIDEFDIAILTKTGQLIVFECKSGDMDGDIAKSTNYSVYAASGVYGKPILITPLRKDEIKDLDSTSIEDGAYKSIKSAIHSASRATLDIWGLDEIKFKILEKLKV